MSETSPATPEDRGRPGSDAPPTMTELTARLLAYVKPYAGVVAIVLLMAMLFAGGRFGRAYLMKPLIDDVLLPAQVAKEPPPLPAGQPADPRAAGAAAVAEHAAGDEAAASTRQIAELSKRVETPAAFRTIVLAALAIVIIMPLAMFARIYLSNWVMGHITIDIQRQLAAKLLTVPLSFHRAGTSGDILSRGLNDANKATGAIRLILHEFLVAIVMVAVGVFALFEISWQLAVISLTTAPLMVGILAFYAGKIRRGARRRQAQMGEVVQRLTAILSGIKVIKAFGGEELESEAFADETRAYFKRTMKVVKTRVLSRSLIDMINNATGIALLVIGAWLVIHDWWGLSTGDIAAFATVLATTYKPTKVLSKGWAQLSDSLASAERFFEVIDANDEPADVENATQLDGIRQGIRFDRVSFSYGREPVLEDISLDVRPGEVIAIVGPTGGGKTTLVDLLLRFHDVDSGSISVDGVDLRHIARRSLLRQVAVVSQEPFLFDTTILENIRYGRPEASEAELLEAASAAHVDDFVGQLPDGYETRVGEFGLHLSGGQRQRITIARAIVKRPSLLVFDEATSALDAKTEKTVHEAIDGLRGERTIFIIAHRLSTIRHADRILVIEDGRVAQLGTHEELVALDGGIYQELVTLQTEGQKSDSAEAG